MKRTTPPRRTNQRRPPRPKQPGTIDIWRTPGGELPELRPIGVSSEPVALMRSLGEPPLRGATDLSKYFESVVERTAAIATALALSVDLIEPKDD